MNSRTGTIRKLAVYLFALILFILNSAFIVHAKSVDTKTDKHLFEFSTAASLGLKVEHAYDPDFITIIFTAPIRVGIFTKKNLALEPEIIFTVFGEDFPFKGKPFFLMNIAYTHFDFNSKIKPFFLFGAGLIRLMPEGWIQIIEPTPKSYLVGDAGGGIKWFVGKKIALRAEYRFIIHKYMRSTITHHKIFLGISFFI